ALSAPLETPPRPPGALSRRLVRTKHRRAWPAPRASQLPGFPEARSRRRGPCPPRPAASPAGRARCPGYARVRVGRCGRRDSRGLARSSCPPERSRSFRWPLRSDVLRADDENDAVDEPERVVEHEPLHLAVVAAAPVRPREERPADLDHA